MDFQVKYSNSIIKVDVPPPAGSIIQGYGGRPAIQWYFLLDIPFFITFQSLAQFWFSEDKNI